MGFPTSSVLRAFGAGVAVMALSATVWARDFPLTLVSFTSPVLRGRQAQVVVRTLPHLPCMLLVQYTIAGRRNDLVLPQRSDDNGRVSWTWRVDPQTAPGSWPVIVHCTKEFKGNVEQARLETTVTVR